MSNKTKWKWIAQDEDGSIYKYGSKPDLDGSVFWPVDHDTTNEVDIVQASHRLVGIAENWKESLINLDEYDYKIVDGILMKSDKLMSFDELCKAFSVPLPEKHAHYKRDVKHLNYIDVYRIIDLYELHDPCFQHALKKILVPGARGHKDLIKDINDIIDTMQRKLEMIAENENKL